MYILNNLQAQKDIFLEIHFNYLMLGVYFLNALSCAIPWSIKTLDVIYSVWMCPYSDRNINEN